MNVKEFNCEFAMRIPVCNWIIAQGLTPILECQSLRNCDIVGVKFEDQPRRISRMIAVELKLYDATRLLQQCVAHIELCSEVWAAMPSNDAEKNADRFGRCGIGMLAVSVDGCSVVLPATLYGDRKFDRWKSFFSRREEYLWRMKHPLMLRFPAQKMEREKLIAELEAKP